MALLLPTFRKLTLNAGSTVTLARAVTVSGSGSLLSVKGTLNPGEAPTYQVTATALTLDATGLLKVNAATFAANYNITGTTTLNASSTVDYAAAGNQTVGALTYGTLRISGSGTKSLAANLPALASTLSTSGNIYVAAGSTGSRQLYGQSRQHYSRRYIHRAERRHPEDRRHQCFPGQLCHEDFKPCQHRGICRYCANGSCEYLWQQHSAAPLGAATKTLPALAFTVAGNLANHRRGQFRSIHGRCSLNCQWQSDPGPIHHLQWRQLFTYYQWQLDQ